MKKSITTLSPARRAAANRRNAEKSTGPRTAGGKSKSRLNAIRHGLSGRTVVLPSEDLAVYQQFSEEIVAGFRPETPFERQLAQTIADCQWRLNRARAIEDGMLAPSQTENNNSPDADRLDITLTAAQVFRETSQAFLNLSTYEQRLARQLDRALRQLQELQAARKAAYPEIMSEAIMFDKQHTMLGVDWNPADDGFAYSRAEIQAAERRRLRVIHANLAEFSNYDLENYRSRLAA